MVRVTGEDLGRLLSTCGNLRSLKIKRCDGLAYLNYVPPPQSSSRRRLKLLVVKHCWAMRNIDVSATGSGLETLPLDGQNLPASLLHGTTTAVLPGVTSASIELEYLQIRPAAKSQACTEEQEYSRLRLLSLARLLPRLRTLSLTLLRQFNVDMSTCPRRDYRFLHLKRVDLTLDMSGRHGRDDFLFLYPFLDAAPGLEHLSLHVMRYAPAFDARTIRRQQQQQQPASHGYFRKHQGLPHHSLKAVDVAGFDADLASLELALHILDKARALRRMSLEPIWIDDDDDDGGVVVDMSWRTRLVREAIARYIAPAVPSGSGIVLQVK